MQLTHNLSQIHLLQYNLHPNNNFSSFYIVFDYLNPLIFEIGGIEIQPGFYIDNYRYVRPIGKGGMADVLLGEDPSNRDVAIKVLKANRFKIGKKRFSREFRTLAKMKHPNVIRVPNARRQQQACRCCRRLTTTKGQN